FDLFDLDPENLTVGVRKKGIRVDLGGIGKGYAVDVMAETLKEWDISSAILDSGGSAILALDPPPGESGWPVGIGRGRHRQTLHLKHRALGASGIAVQGEHIINPHTGQPVKNRTRVWALASSATMADGLSTAFMIMPEKAIREVCRKHDEVSAMLLIEKRLGRKVRKFGRWDDKP
ncbi:MAG: FAD:protein FMN transferase, partial [Verrucomicrobiota bacterium]